jgi:hypothetical protein
MILLHGSVAWFFRVVLSRGSFTWFCRAVLSHGSVASMVLIPLRVFIDNAFGRADHRALAREHQSAADCGR